jgi:hypothetical protein
VRGDFEIGKIGERGKIGVKSDREVLKKKKK